MQLTEQLTISRQYLTLGWTGNPRSLDSISQCLILIPGFLNPCMRGINGLKSSTSVFMWIDTCCTPVLYYWMINIITQQFNSNSKITCNVKWRQHATSQCRSTGVYNNHYKVYKMLSKTIIKNNLLGMSLNCFPHLCRTRKLSFTLRSSCSASIDVSGSLIHDSCHLIQSEVVVQRSR